MALPAVMLELVCHAAREQRGGAACAAGYPDLLVTPDQLDRLLGAGASAQIPTRPDSEQILQWHGLRHVMSKVFDSEATFARLGYRLDVIDLVAARGNEIIVDLNQPLEPGRLNPYDLVVDTGTCEHCFHVGQAALNLAALVRVGGIIVQAMPLNLFNHGFYNINPTWFLDFYPANGFRILFLQAFANAVNAPQPVPFPGHERFSKIPENCVFLLAAKREEARPPTIPTQRKYAVNPTLSG